MADDPLDSMSTGQKAGQYAVNLLLEVPMRIALALPYPTRVRLIGWVASRLVAPLAGWRGRVRDNLARVWPDMPKAEVERLVREVPDNAGRTLIEIYSGDDVRKRLPDFPLEGPGLAAFEAEVAAGRPIICVSGHFGNYTMFRAAMAVKYGQMAALYRPLNNVYFNRHYVAAMLDNATPLFPRTRRGLAEMVKFLRQGNMVAMLHDQHFSTGATLEFFGHPAQTALSPAELALKYGAAVFPIYNIRQPDGLSFRMVVEEAIPHSDPETMTQAMNDSLEAMIRQYPEQWLWIHRRWKAAG
ncbi:lauroyl acyltransferase [Pseudooceanicola sp. 216_PA32_1]|uniref:Lauroyl acyltransferase n=1 Tax=Pseudooceanicola pacificus TaxID=2676438 RepID=A0A844VZR3_9RHOB|nr:lysophospholipid acyltransferase family protein [Pseudooceanicola pacificus]MWB77296.1 lauroyl acyltransferase [Pseudooceanicola pacificus]